MKIQQLEISLKAPACPRPPTRRQQRRARALWWFKQMRRVVDEAVEWKAAPRVPEQAGQLLDQGQ